MAMMMTGRVLLVCALCVLWCGAGGVFGEGLVESRAGVSGSGGEHSLASKQLENSPQDTQGSHGRVPGVKGKVPPASPGLKAEEEEFDDEEDDDSDNDEDEGTEDEVKITERQGDKGGTAAPESDSREKNLSVGRQEKNQAIISAEEIPPSDSRETNANPTQPEVEGTNTDENTPAAKNPLTTVNGENTLPGGVAGGNLPSPPEDGVDSHEQSGEDTTSEGKKNVSSPETAATPQSHRDEGSEGTGEDTKATTVIDNTTDTTNAQNSDGSTAVSHTTSPLLLLLACAAAAAVVAA
ncbi:mucin-associated surface protein [Trypanosoma cruzi cruzi]|uniref:Mucin-associated surface protein (MASP) n=1 Tax=Trypanosoma cruzi TaxID=5693 RepID=A0A2V2VXF4_TRYCR|nr:mucin-associated surface protein [Trypanosoma cruzi cruzi]PWV01082.1 Mucin-associated surface protein (MASP) [Trypanosoma cruzi]